MSYDFGHLYLQLMFVGDSNSYRRAVLNPSTSPSRCVFAVTLGGCGGLFGKCKITEMNSRTEMLHSKWKNSRDLNNIWLLNIPKPLALLKLFCKSEVSILPVTFKTFKPSCTSYESKRILLLLYFRFSVLKKRELLNNSTKTKTYLYIFCFVHCNLNSLTTWYCHIIRLVPVQQQVLQVRTLLNHYLNPWIKILYIITSKNSECKAKLYINIKKSALNCLIRLFCDLPTMKTRAPPAAALIM